ncbi:MAG: hypothetical protein ABIP46_10050 [Polaromonas sp.]
MKSLFIAFAALLLTACSTYMPQRYSISADNNVALKAIGLGSINVGPFKGPAKFDNACRGAGPIAPPDNMSFESYIQKALADELKVAGMFDDKTPRVSLSGVVTRLEFSSSRGLTGGTWDMNVTFNSSNGKTISVVEHYEFNSGFIADTACKQTAESFLPAVQNLISKLVKNPQFKAMLST